MIHYNYTGTDKKRWAYGSTLNMVRGGMSSTDGTIISSCEYVYVITDAKLQIELRTSEAAGNQ